MTKLIIDATTGTVLNVENCYIVDADKLENHDYSDSELSALAQEHGKSVYKMGTATGWGDNAYRWTVSYSPMSIKDEANAYIEGGIYQDWEPEYEILQWFSDEATVDELEEVSNSIMSDDSLWDGFRTNLMGELKFYYQNKFGEKE